MDELGERLVRSFDRVRPMGEEVVLFRDNSVPARPSISVDVYEADRETDDQRVVLTLDHNLESDSLLGGVAQIAAKTLGVAVRNRLSIAPTMPNAYGTRTYYFDSHGHAAKVVDEKRVPGDTRADAHGFRAGGGKAVQRPLSPGDFELVGMALSLLRRKLGLPPPQDSSSRR